MKFKVLIAEDDAVMGELLSELVVESGFEPLLVDRGSDAASYLEKCYADVLLTDLRLPAPDGLELLKLAKSLDPGLPVIMITGYATVPDAVEGFRNGLFDLITKPFDTEQVVALLGRVHSLLQHRRRIEQLDKRLSQLDRSSSLVMESPAARKSSDLARQVAALDVPVLISGETGTGKGVLARYIHSLSPRSNGPYFVLNCAAIAESLIDNELFGHEKGAYTGATARKRGLLELADGGTLLLDEINSTTPAVQAKLLQFMQDRILTRLGGEHAVEVDVRLIVSTNQDLQQLVKDGRFRQDLFFRLNVFPIQLPPLRERAEDIPLLSQQFIQAYAGKFGRPARQVSEGALQCLQRYSWPGNIRELENIIQRAVVLADDRVIGIDTLPGELSQGGTLPKHTDAAWRMDATLDEVQEYWINKVLENCKGNKAEAARRLGIDASTLHRKLRSKRI